MTMLDSGGGAAAMAAPEGLIKETTTQGFMKDVIEESKRQPVLIDFWAPWCGPCKQLTPLLEKIVKNAKGAVKLVKMNIDDHPAIPGQMGIQSIPAVIAFVNGQPADGFMGALPESQILAFIDRVTKGKAGGNETAELIKSADVAIAEGDTQGAAEIYSHILEEDPANVPALAGLARCHVANNELEKAKQVLTQVPAAKQNDAAVAAARAALEVAEQASSVGPIGELEQKVAANPLDHQARFDLAVALNAAGKRQEAVDRLMEIIRRDRKWNEDGARKQLVQLFEAWGPTDEATVAGRKTLSSVLFA